MMELTIVFALILFTMHLMISNYDVKQKEKELHKLAYYDNLTKLSNRLYFNEQAPKLLRLADDTNRNVCIFLVDVDGFKSVNDTYGHQVGDVYLQKISDKLTNLIGTQKNLQDNEIGFVSRLGGDEFVVIFTSIQTAQDAEFVAETLFETLSDPIEIDPSIHINPSLSVGISIYPYDGNTLSTALKSADLALYAVKQCGKNKFALHNISMNTKFEQSQEYKKIIEYFIDTEDFNITYQPIINTQTNQITCVEVLFGGNKAKFPDLNVQEMMKIAESDKTIIELGALILKRACEEYVNTILFSSPQLRLSVNVSAVQLNDPYFVEFVENILNTTSMSAKNLEFELTETAIITNYYWAHTKLTKLKNIGIKISIDDFGKGYSSMSNLKQLNVNKIKIDKSFIDDLLTDPKSPTIVSTLIKMSETLNLECVVEGVEIEEQYMCLKQLGCKKIQGYYISKPLSLMDLESFIK